MDIRLVESRKVHGSVVSLVPLALPSSRTEMSAETEEAVMRSNVGRAAGVCADSTMPDSARSAVLASARREYADACCSHPETGPHDAAGDRPRWLLPALPPKPDVVDGEPGGHLPGVDGLIQTVSDHG